MNRSLYLARHFNIDKHEFNIHMNCNLLEADYLNIDWQKMKTRCTQSLLLFCDTFEIDEDTFERNGLKENIEICFLRLQYDSCRKMI